MPVAERLGDFRVVGRLCSPELNRISAGDRTIQVEPKVMAVLALLAERSGRVVTREELLDAVWPQTAVTEQVLTRAISELRKALGDDSRTPRIIETIAKGGYRLIAPVEWLQQSSDAEGVMAARSAETHPRTRRREAWLLPVGIGLGVFVTMLLGWMWSRAPGDARSRTLQLSLVLPAETAPGMGYSHAFALSPDGRLFVYATVVEGRRRLYVRPLDRDEARALPGTEDAFGPFFSPDGRSIGFYLGGTLRRLSLDGEPPVQVTEGAYDAIGADWADDGTIVYSKMVFAGLHVVPSSGGPGRALTHLNPAAGEIAHAWPHFLPGGKRLLFTVWHGAGMRTHDIDLLDLESGARRTLVRGGSRPHYLPDGRLLFARPGQLMVVRFDPERLQLLGTPVPVIEGLQTNPLTGAAHYDVSRDGTLVYAPLSTSAPLRTFSWIARDGTEQPVSLPPRAYADPRLSPDGHRIVVTLQASAPHLYVIDLGRGTTERLTSCDADLWPVWAPDGKRVVYTAVCEGAPSLYWKEARADAVPERLTRGTALERAGSWSADGRLLAYASLDPKTRWDVWLIPVTGDRGPMPVLTSPYDESEPALSPDGRLIAYVSNLAGTGPWEVYLSPLSDERARVQVSSEGGGHPFWSPDGGTLYYVSDDELRGASVTQRPRLQVGSSRAVLRGLREREIVGLAPGLPTRFLVLARHDPAARVELKVLVGWSAGHS